MQFVTLANHSTSRVASRPKPRIQMLIRKLTPLLCTFALTCVWSCGGDDDKDSGSGGASAGGTAGAKTGGGGGKAGNGGGGVGGKSTGGSTSNGGSGGTTGEGGANSGGRAEAGDTSTGGTGEGGAGGEGADNGQGSASGGRGGTSGGGNGGNGGAAGGPTTTVVWSWGQKGNEGPLQGPDWVVDSVHGAQEGTTAAHPPALTAATPLDVIIDCGAQSHTELSFYLAKFSSAPTLDLLIDGKVRYQLRTTSTWSFDQYIFDVPAGKHTYTFRAQSASDAANSFAIDSIVCKTAEAKVSNNGVVDFDRGFIPPETTGGWLVDNLDAYSDGSTTPDEAAIHPPALQANTPVELNFDCGEAPHTELSFYLAKFSSAPTLDLLIDGKLRYQLRTTSTWSFDKYLFDVPQGKHTYTFRAQSATDAATSFAIDFLQCKNITPEATTNGTVDFDRGFIPLETTGDWQIDNIDTYSDGSATTDEAAIHPPALQANTPVEMSFNCADAPHTELTFYLAKFSSAPTLDLLIDGKLRQHWSTTNTWSFDKYLFDVPQGKHTYTFRAQASADTAKSFAIDFIQCKNVTPVASSNGTVDFDRGFIPPETAGAWLVDNLNTYSDGSTTTDEAAIHPPALSANTAVDMTFNCGQTHSKLSFYLAKFASAPTLDLLMDGTALQSLSGSGTWSFKKYTLDVASGTHTYTFRAQSASDTPTSYAVDFFQCTP